MSNLPCTATEYRAWWNTSTEAPWGTCWCLCGEPTNISSDTNLNRILFKGAPLRFKLGHKNRKSPHPYVPEDRGYNTPCWIWQWKMGSNGYGQLWDADAGQMRNAHRVLYERRHGPLSENTDVHHRCEQKDCVRLNHLKPMSAAKHQRIHRQSAKLNYEAAERIRNLYATGECTQDYLANIFGVSQYAISLVVRRLTWREP